MKADAVTTLTAAEQVVLDAIDEGALVQLVSDLIAIPSLPSAENPAQRHVAEVLRAMGADVDVWTLDLPSLERHPHFSAEVPHDDSLGVIGRFGLGQAGAGTLLLNGHVDVVPTGPLDDWVVTAPFTPLIADGKLYGRGSCDTKGGLAAALHAMAAIQSAGVQLRGEVRLVSVVGEEDGGCGTLAALVRGATADGCIVLEPTELSVVPANAGALSFRIRIRGLAAHGAMREEGVSAIEKLPIVQRALIALERERNHREADPLFGWLQLPFAICAGRVEGGSWPSTEADWLKLEGRYGVGPDEDLDAARAELERAVANAALTDPWLAEHPPTVEWWGGQFLPGRTAVSDPLVGTVTAAFEAAAGRNAVVRGMPYGCDMGLTTRVGHIPTVVFGPGDVRNAHTADEYVPVADLLECARTIALSILRTCGGILA
jgi:acetylornithine deacetylase